MTTVRVSERGLISIPAAARRKLGIKPKSNVLIEVRENEIAIKPMKSIMEVAGIHDILAKSLGSANPINVVKATMLGLSRLRDPQAVRRLRRASVIQTQEKSRGNP